MEIGITIRLTELRGLIIEIHRNEMILVRRVEDSFTIFGRITDYDTIDETITVACGPNQIKDLAIYLMAKEEVYG